MAEPLLIAQNANTHCELLPALTNRHGLITGATGTGKTVTLQAMAEQLSRIGVPVFLTDIKGDLSGISQAGHIEGKLAATLAERGLPTPASVACPTTFWDVFGEQGHPVRATISDMGPLLLARMLDLNDIQSGVLNIVFKIADDQGLLLLDLKDLRSALQYVADNAKEFTTSYGNISSSFFGAKFGRHVEELLVSPMPNWVILGGYVAGAVLRGLMVGVIVITLWALLTITAGVWLWATTFLRLGAFTTLEESLYFSLVSFTTLGYGDVLLPKDLRILGALAGVNGMLSIGVLTAMIIDTIRVLRQMQGRAQTPPEG